jgi:hypothetical protein
MPARIGIVWRNAHEPVHTGFRLQPAIGILALDLHGYGFQAGFFAGAGLDHFGLEAAGLRPAQIHARQHLRPVLTLRPAGAGVDFEKRVVAVRLAGVQRLDFERGRLSGKLGQRFLRVGDDLRVALILTQCDEFEIVLQAGFKLGIGVDGIFELLALAHDGACILRIVPEGRIFGACVQFLQADRGVVPVKDASATA